MNLDLKGKRAVVCGSTQGIGRAVAEELAILGASVTLVARNETSLKEVKDNLSESAGQDHNYLVVDFSDPESLKSVLKYYNEDVSILVNNTGGPAGGPIIDAEYDQFDKTLTAHLHCNHILTQAFVTSMKSKGYGRIVNIISTSVKQPIKGLGVSNTVRGAVASWSKTLSLELGQYGITVNNVLPGFTSTARLDYIVSNKAQKTGLSNDEGVSQMESETPANRIGLPEEVAAVAAFLATPAAGYVNGVSIPVDGGKTGSI